MVKNYQAVIEKTPDSLADIAYTLANRREHLPHRSFIVATRNRTGIASSLSTSKKAGQGLARPVVMVFTGQGAQSPQMGRELLRSNPIFRATIKSLDQYLQSLGTAAPSWTIEEELLKPARTSRVNDAEFSQPLCTALQLALIDTFASVGIEPAAVVGHSSGEIAAAYAAGGLTAEEAIAVAFHRGVITKQTRRGAMAAVGLSWEEAEKHLLPSIVIACDNSPNSVTLSGDADQLELVVAEIKKSQPNVLASTLKVEKAYHSHYMAEVGEEYYQAMISSKVVGKTPSKPFLSSVTGGLLEETAKDSQPQLGPRYWQKNLESPVLFKGAVSAILQHHAASNAVFLEVGPHAALAGPLRQIFTQASSLATHVPSLTRKQDSLEGFLSSVGKLYTLNVAIDFKALMPHGSCLPDLPRYPWNHNRTHWFESRVSKEWRLREYPYHDLLGVKLPESTDLEPVWRNVFHIDNAPWVRDHRIKDDIVFPFAGYVAMAAEAVRQVSKVQEGVSFRRVIVSTALVVNEGTPTELVTTFRRHRLTDSLDSQWWEFTITSHNGHIWTKHCTGEVRPESKPPPAEITEVPGALPRKISMRKWYETVRRGGLDYGPHFTSLEDVTTSTTSQRLATAKTRNNWHGDEANYHLHPVILDSYFQLLGFAARYGLTHDYRQVVPTIVESLTIFHSSADYLTVNTSAEIVGVGVRGKGSCIADSKMVLQISGVNLSPLYDADAGSGFNVPITARCEWVQHIDFRDFNTLIKPSYDHKLHAPVLEELAQFAIALSQRAAASAEVQVEVPHMQKYKTWIDQQTSSSLENFDDATLVSRIDSLVKSLAESPAAHAATAIAKVCTNSVSMFSGEKGAVEVLNTDDTLNKLQGFMKEYNGSEFFQSLGHSKPNLQVLELGAGGGSATAGILKDLTRADGQVLYSQYVFSDKSSGIINSTKDNFKGVLNMAFATLDIGKDLEGQGFQDRQFDLIIATGVISTTTTLQESLGNVRKLLSPNGRLILQEPRSGLTWAKYIYGTLPSWWCGTEDSRPDEPCVSQSRWEEELIAAGFQGLDGVVLDSLAPFHLNTIIVATPRQDKTPAKRVTLLCSTETSDPGPLAQELEARGYELSRCTIKEVPPPGQDVIALLEREKPFFEGIDLDAFEDFKRFVESLGGSGILWITQPSQTHCSDPRYALVIGLARTIRSEMAIDFATCETEDLDSAVGSNAIADVFRKFHEREDDGVLSPDFEYAIGGGVTRISRFFPFSLDKELLVSEPSDEVLLTIGRAGRLDTLTWSREPAIPPPGNEVEVEVYAAGLNFRVSLRSSNDQTNHSNTNITKIRTS
jgi:acyl transferase domain-containing protein